MNVIIANEYANLLTSLNIDVIKNLTGTYDVSEIGDMFSNFLYERIIIDVTALTSYDSYSVYHELKDEIDPGKTIILLPEGSRLCTPNFLIHLIEDGFYNFTTSIDGIYYLLNKPNTYKEVEHIVNMATTDENNSETDNNTNESLSNNSDKRSTIIGFKNITESGGATTLIYMIKKELAIVYGQDNVMAIEIDKNDFTYFFDKKMISIRQDELLHELKKYEGVHFILVDVNGCKDLSFCNEVIYLIEPSTLKMNRLIRKNPDIFKGLNNKKIVLNQCILQPNEVYDFEKESGINVFYTIPVLDERKRNSVIGDFLNKLGFIGGNNSNSSSGKIFGLFRR